MSWECHHAPILAWWDPATPPYDSGQLDPHLIIEGGHGELRAGGRHHLNHLFMLYSRGPVFARALHVLSFGTAG